MRIAIMQPYFFPYIGYFQLIHAVDKFVFYDDVNYIKGGWINRNRIIINNTVKYITIGLRGASSNKTISEVTILDNRREILRTIEMAYKRAPRFNEVWHLIEECLLYQTDNIADIAENSVVRVCNYLEVNPLFERSSARYSHTQGVGKVERLIGICKVNNADRYINPIGGKELYTKERFANDNIQLFFLEPHIPKYIQFTNPFVPGLSIIDVLMFNSKEAIQEMLTGSKLL